MPKDPPMLLIKNGRVIDPARGTDAKLNIWVDGDRIARIGPAEAPERPASPNGQTLDATGLVVAPGFIDLHCHLREPGGESSETVETGTRAAARGGFTAVCPIPTPPPLNYNASVPRAVMERAAAVASTRVWPIGAVPFGTRRQALPEIVPMQKP